jgi:hypothetical protein
MRQQKSYGKKKLISHLRERRGGDDAEKRR